MSFSNNMIYGNPQNTYQQYSFRTNIQNNYIQSQFLTMPQDLNSQSIYFENWQNQYQQIPFQGIRQNIYQQPQFFIKPQSSYQLNSNSDVKNTPVNSDEKRVKCTKKEKVGISTVVVAGVLLTSLAILLRKGNLAKGILKFIGKKSSGVKNATQTTAKLAKPPTNVSQAVNVIPKKAPTTMQQTVRTSTKMTTKANKGKVSKAKQLAEHIEFREAKTFEEAQLFAKENFGINLQIDNNVEVANFLNKIFVNVNNKLKGKANLPNSVVHKSINSTDGVSGFAAWNEKNKTLTLDGFWQYVNKAEKKGMSFNEMLSQVRNKATIDNEYITRAIYHEIGHANHKNHLKMLRLSELKAIGYKDTHYTDEFLQAVKDNKIVTDFFEHNTVPRFANGTLNALSSPAEFVADTFSLKMLGKTIPKEVETIYQKYGGPLVNL